MPTPQAQGKQKIVNCLWFDSEAEEAAKFYVQVFSGSPKAGQPSKVGEISRYPDAGQEITGKPAGSVLTVVFELEGQRFMALNGGSQFKFSEAISLMVYCIDQDEVDYFWGKLSADPASEQCGWLKDKYGLSWQVVPEGADELFTDPDPEKSRRAMEAMLKMKKLDINELRKAAEGE